MPFSIAYLDVDEFKKLNDQFGHTTGDRLLVVTASNIRQALRGMDVVARLGGEEVRCLAKSAAIIPCGTLPSDASRKKSSVRLQINLTWYACH